MGVKSRAGSNPVPSIKVYKMKFLIFNRNLTEQESIVTRNCSEPHIWISIRNNDDFDCKLPENHFRKASLFLMFDDDEKERPGVILMTDKQAKQIVEFVDENKKGIDLICVNCEAGKSRSSAVALALSELMNGHDSGIRGNSNYCPNLFVKDLIIKHGDKLMTDNTPSWYRDLNN